MARFQRYMINPESEVNALRALGGVKDARVLEIGCGDGRLTYLFAAEARSVLALDTKAESIEEAKKNLPADLAGRVRFEVLNALDLDFPPASFDTALFSLTL